MDGGGSSFLQADQQGVVESPEDEGPRGAVPESADEEDGEGVAQLEGARTAVAAERDIDVVAQPRHQGDVPAAPEVGDAGGEIGCAEVLHEFDAEEAGAAHGDVGVAGEVAVDLDGEEEGSDEECQCALLSGCLPDNIHGEGAGVCHNHLLAEAPEHLAQAIDSPIIIKGTRAKHLRQEVGGALDGSCHELREEADVGEEGRGIAGGGEAAAIDVDGIAEGLEGVEGDAHREDEVEGEGVGVEATGAEQSREVRGEEVEVFEESEDAQVEADVGSREGAAPRLPAFTALDGQAADVAGSSRQGYEQQETPVPPAVEDVAGQDDEGVLPSQVTAESPVQGEDDGQEEEEREGGEGQVVLV